MSALRPTASAILPACDGLAMSALWSLLCADDAAMPTLRAAHSNKGRRATRRLDARSVMAGKKGMRDINGRNIWPEPGLFFLFLFSVLVLIPLALSFVMYGMAALHYFAGVHPVIGIMTMIVVGYLLLCLPGLLAGGKK
jgi:hypothetical protein